MTKKGPHKCKKQLVRDVEKWDIEPLVQREFVISTLNDLKPGGNKCNVAGLEPNISKSSAKEALKGNEDVSKDAVGTISRKASRKLNFPFYEVLYRDLIPLNDVNLTTLKQPIKHLPRPPRKLDPAVEAVQNPLYPKNEFLFLQFGIKGIERSSQNSKKSIFGLPECVKTFKDPKSYDEKEKRVIQTPSINVVQLEGASSGLGSFRHLHASLGIERPKLQYHFDGFALHKKSKSWKL